jgi:L-seryl-tRNA(Ser) seleniumtransferase
MVAVARAMPTSDSDPSAVLRKLPSIDALLRAEELADLPRRLLLATAREWLAELRERLRAGPLPAGELLLARLRERCLQRQEPRHQRVYNATGIVLHTGLGRAPLAPAAIDAIVAAAGYSIVELDPATGERDQRELGIAALLRELTGAAGALVVNNNAAAATLMLSALCAGREVVISRGELVEIGGGFRVPEVMQRAGCQMVEVGATNKTHLRDYEAHSSAATVAWLKVHPSNYRIEGFASVPSLAELAGPARARGLLLLEDLGSGLLWEAALPGLGHEPRVHQSLRDGADVVAFSGDKLLGGPQCGILLGSAERIAQCRAHPLYRALRCDKLTLAALEATLRIYRDGEPLQEIPTLRMLAAEPAELRDASERLATLLGGPASVVASESFAGAGANPARALPSFAVALPGGDAEAAALRRVRPIAVFARRFDGRLLLDARTLLVEDAAAVAAAVRRGLPTLFS